MDAQEEIRNVVRTFFEKLSFPSLHIEVSSQDTSDRTILCRVDVAEPRSLIGKNGEVLASINHLVRKIVCKKHSRFEEQHNPAEENVVIDLDGYQQRRIENLKNTAHMLAERAKFFKSSISADPMNAFERRIVHEFLSGRTDIRTESVGEGDSRYVVIRYCQG